MKRGSTIILKGVVLIIGLFALAFGILALPRAIILELRGDFDYLPLLIGLYIPIALLITALYQAFKLLNYIDRSKAFSDLSVRALRNIKYCAFLIGALFTAGMPYIFYLADKDDAPGLAALGFIIIGASFIVALAAAVFQKLLQNAVDLKSENDLTV